MRYTLSVLTAACLLVLGQPAWAETTDRDFALRARNAVLALPDTDRASAKQLLQQLQASAATTPATPQRHLPFHRVFSAVNGMLQQHYTTAVSAHLLAQPLLAPGWIRPPVEQLGDRMPMELDTAMVERFLTPWLDVTA